MNSRSSVLLCTLLALSTSDSAHADLRQDLKLTPHVIINGKHFDPDIHLMLYVSVITAPPTRDGIIWVTSAWRPNGKHSTNEAFDIRIKNVKGFTYSYNTIVANWAERIRSHLGYKYDVLYGDPDHMDHIHIEFDPE